MKAYLSSPAALAASVRERRQPLGTDPSTEEPAEDITLARLLALCGDAHDELVITWSGEPMSLLPERG